MTRERRSRRLLSRRTAGNDAGEFRNDNKMFRRRSTKIRISKKVYSRSPKTDKVDTSPVAGELNPKNRCEQKQW